MVNAKTVKLSTGLTRQVRFVGQTLAITPSKSSYLTVPAQHARTTLTQIQQIEIA